MIAELISLKMKIYKNNQIIISFNELELIKIAERHLRKNQTETGGIIVGYYSDNLLEVYITNFYNPPKDSKLGVASFVRGVNGLEKLLQNEWKHGKYYLGDWHLHPYNNPIASCQDLKQLTLNSKDNDLHCPEPIMVIIGGIDNKEINVYIHMDNKIHLCEAIN